MSDPRRWVRELHRRSLWQVLLIYLTASWVVYQVALDLAEGLGLPDWVAPTALILLMVGLPIVLATAFIQEGGPGGGATAAPPDPQPDAAAAPPAPPPAHETGAGASASRFFTWRNAVAGGIGAFALLGVVVAAFMASRLLGIGPAATLLAQGTLTEDARILLVDASGPPADSAIAEMVTEALRVDLEQSPVVRLVEPRLVRDALARMQRDSAGSFGTEVALELATREGIPAVLTSELHRAGGSLVLAARLLSPPGGAALASFRQTAADSTSIVDAVDRLSADIRARIGESLSSIRSSPPLERVTTRSLTALERYTRAVRLLRDEPESREAAALLEQAVAADSSFAMAWLQLGRLYGFFEEDFGLSEREADAVARAYRFAERLSPRERLLAEAWYHDRVMADQEARHAAIQRLLAEHPDDLEGLNELVEYRLARRDYREAQRALERLLALDSTWALAADGEWLLAAYLGDTAGAASALDRYAARFPADSFYVLTQRAYLAASAGDYERADSIWRRLVAPGQGNLYDARSYFGRASVARARGRLEDYLALRAESTRSLGVPAVAVGFDRDLAAMSSRAWLGLPADAELATVRRSIAAGVLDSLPPSWTAALGAAASLAIAGAPAEGRRVLDRWIASASDSLERASESGIANARGEIALAEERLDAALDAFRRVREVTDCPECGLVDIGRVHDAAARPDSAIAAWEEYLETPNPYRISRDGQSRAFVLERLARLYEQRGDLAKARTAWAEFIELWRDADAELQPRVEAARRRLQALVARAG